MNLASQIRSHIKANRTNDALELLLLHTKSDKHWYNKTTLLQSRYNHWKYQTTFLDKQLDAELQSIHDAILYLLDQMSPDENFSGPKEPEQTTAKSPDGPTTQWINRNKGTILITFFTLFLISTITFLYQYLNTYQFEVDKGQVLRFNSNKLITIIQTQGLTLDTIWISIDRSPIKIARKDTCNCFRTTFANYRLKDDTYELRIGANLQDVLDKNQFFWRITIDNEMPVYRLDRSSEKSEDSIKVAIKNTSLEKVKLSIVGLPGDQKYIAIDASERDSTGIYHDFSLLLKFNPSDFSATDLDKMVTLYLTDEAGNQPLVMEQSFRNFLMGGRRHYGQLSETLTSISDKPKVFTIGPVPQINENSASSSLSLEVGSSTQTGDTISILLSYRLIADSVVFDWHITSEDFKEKQVTFEIHIETGESSFTKKTTKQNYTIASHSNEVKRVHVDAHNARGRVLHSNTVSFYWPPDWPQYPMITVEGGRFLKGAYNNDLNNRSYEKPAHWVELSTYQIGQYEVTQKLYEAVMGENPSRFNDCPDCPVEQVSWKDAQIFIQCLNETTKANFRLPSEAEWEFAAGGGNPGHDPQTGCREYIYAGSNDINAVAWYNNNSDSKTHPVGKLQSNQLDIYDMSGNVDEWCHDWYNSNYHSDTYEENEPLYIPKGPETGGLRVMRGGSWFGIASYCMIAHGFNFPVFRFNHIGFRLVRDL